MIKVTEPCNCNTENNKKKNRNANAEKNSIRRANAILLVSLIYFLLVLLITNFIGVNIYLAISIAILFLSSILSIFG